MGIIKRIKGWLYKWKLVYVKWNVHTLAHKLIRDSRIKGQWTLRQTNGNYPIGRTMRIKIKRKNFSDHWDNNFDIHTIRFSGRENETGGEKIFEWKWLTCPQI